MKVMASVETVLVDGDATQIYHLTRFNIRGVDLIRLWLDYNAKKTAARRESCCFDSIIHL